jgi:NAD(P)-dependent dehydrogenase (short-subunit alcohol dehydrogenase family)
MSAISTSKTYVVTGGTSGIGLALVEALLRLGPGAEVVVPARNPRRAEEVAAGLRSATGRAPEFVHADLSSIAGARDAAAKIGKKCPRIDVLVHNAGVWPTRLARGPEGFEESFITNHLAPFIITKALNPRIPAGGRIVQVTAGLYPIGKYDPEKTPKGLDFNKIRTYANTKLANLLVTRRWADVLSPGKIDVNSVHPGVIRTGLGASGGLIGRMMDVLKLALAGPDYGAKGPLRLATDPALSGVTGRYYNQLKETRFRAPATDDKLIAAAWKQAEELTS